MSKGRKRAGAQLLVMAADPIKRRILQEMAKQPLAIGPGQEYRVTAGGREALFVGFVVERWLQGAPDGPLPFESRQAQRAVAALADAWSTTVMHSLAREPLTLTDLRAVVEEQRPGELERRLAAMRNVGQIEKRLDNDGQIVYAMTDWLRSGIAPLIASARLERRDPGAGMAPIDALDVEAGFRCSLPLVELPKELSGTCRLGINLDEDANGSLTGVTARIDRGHVVSCRAGLDGKADAWAAGTAGNWLDTVIEPDAKRVRIGGDKWLTRALLDSMHRTLFGIQVV